MINRTEAIKKKGFDMTRTIGTKEASPIYNPVDFAKLKVGVKSLTDATYEFGDYKKTNPRLGDKKEILRAIDTLDYESMREISNFFFRTSGIYSRLCRYMAYLYRYDWLITPHTIGDVKPEKISDGFNKALNTLESFEVKKFCGEVALKVIKNGCYYGYMIPTPEKMRIQELPPKYCRSRFFGANGLPAVEFNMKFFDDAFRDTAQRMRMLSMFPPEFKKGYNLYKEGKLIPDFMGDTSGWYLLDIDKTIKFNLNGEDYPAFISVIPAIIDLNEAQALDRKKMQQQLLKIIIQKMPIDKNGDLVFDVDEAAELHNNVVGMVGKAIGLDVLTTFADVEVADMADKNTTTTKDDLAKVERTVYNEAGVSQMQFNTDGNIALEKSILNDEAAMYNLLLQFETFLNRLLAPYNKNKKLIYKAQLLTTTIYNYKEMAKLFKEQTQLGYSKMLPQIALGQTQSSILATAHFENDVLDLVNIFIPPLMSSTMNAEVLNRGKGGDASEEKKSGRKEKPNDEKSEKTIQNRESMN